MNPNTDPLGLSQFRNAMLAKYPNMNKTQLASLDDFLSKKAQTALVTAGDIPFADFAKSSPVDAYNLRAGGYQPTVELDANAKKRQAALSAAIPVLARMTDSALKAPQGIGGSLLASAGNVPGVEGGEAEFLARQADGFARLIANTFASEVGVATDEDVKRWKKIMPRPGDTLSERKRIIGDMITQVQQESEAKGIAVPPQIYEIAAKIGASTPTKGQPMEKAPKGMVQSLIESLLSPATDTLRTIGGAGHEVLNELAGRPASTRGLKSDNPFLNAEEINKYDTDPAGQVLNQAGRSAVLAAPAFAGGVGATGLKGALAKGAIYGGAYGGATPREGFAPMERISDVASGAATGAALSGATYGALQVAAKAGKILHPFRTVGEVRKAAIADAQGATINGDDILMKLQDSTSTISPTQRVQFSRYITQAEAMFKGKEVPLSQAVDILEEANRAGYMASGKGGKAATAVFNRVLGDSIRQQVSKVAPKVGEANKLFSLLYGGQRATKGLKHAAMTSGTFKLMGLLGL